MKKYYITIFIFAIVALLASPVMNVQTVEIIGNSKFSDNDILDMAGFSNDTNIFEFSKNRAVENLKGNTYIKSVKIQKDFISRKLVFNVEERRLSGYVKINQGNYLYVDRNGMVLECRTFFTENRPVIEGLGFSEFTVGQILKPHNEKAFDTMVTLSHLFEKFEIETDIIRVDISKSDDIHFFYGNIDILLGDSNDLDLKVRTIKGILPTFDDEKESGGFLYIQNTDVPYFTRLT